MSRTKKPKREFTWRDHPKWTEKTRSERWLRETGWEVGNVEYRLPGCFITVDLFNFGDLLAMRDFCPHLIVQSTDATNVSKRRDKIGAEPRAATWLRTGGEIHVHGWNRPSPGGRREEWSLRINRATLNDHGAIEWSEVPEAGAREAGT